MRKKVLIVAPGFVPPWSEGRKNFILDLAPPLSKYWDVEVLSADYEKKFLPEEWPLKTECVRCHNRFSQLPALHRALRKKLSAQNKPDAVLHFPFGTFDGLRGAANKWSMGVVDRMARSCGLPCLTILYAVTKGDMAALSKKAGLLAASGGRGWDGPVVNIGINLERTPLVRKMENTKKLLFMAGLSENKRSQFNNILYVRGLIDILKIGERLAVHGFTLTIAAPIFQCGERRKELSGLLKKMAPSLKVNIDTLVDINKAFNDHCIYLFPFRENHARFVPTSVLEAMAAGIPLIASDLPMMDLIFDSNPHCGKRFAARDSEALLEAILDRTNNWEQTARDAELASGHARRFWDINNSAKQIVDLIVTEGR